MKFFSEPVQVVNRPDMMTHEAEKFTVEKSSTVPKETIDSSRPQVCQNSFGDSLKTNICLQK